MKKTFRIFIFLIAVKFLLPSFAYAQTPSWLWARQAGTNMDVNAFSVTTDASNNNYVLGSFAGASIAFGNVILTSSDGGANFLVKYNSNGHVNWAKSFEGNDYDKGTSVIADNFGNLYVVGWFYSDTIVFGSDTLYNNGVGGYQSGYTDIFIAKYDTAGNVLWAKSAGGILSDSALSVTTDKAGNVYMSGAFSSPSLIFGPDTLINSGKHDMFVAQFDANGNVIWAKNAVGNGDDYGQSVTTDLQGNCYVAGFFHSLSITFDTINLVNYDQSVWTYADIFLVKYNAEGNVIWAKKAGGIKGDFAQSVSSDTIGNVYMGGNFFGSTATFDNIILTNSNLAGTSVFLAKYNSDGNVLWAKNSVGSNYDDIWSIVANPTGDNVYITGQFASHYFLLDTIILYNPNNSPDVYVAKYNSSGNIIWAIRAGGTDEDISESIALDASGDICIAGHYRSPNLNFGNYHLTSSNSAIKMFIAKLGIITGINEYYNEFDVFIFPNPANDNLTIETPQKSSIEIINIQGQLIKTLTSSGNKTNIDVSALPCGVYIVEVKTEKGMAVKKFVKE